MMVKTASYCLALFFLSPPQVSPDVCPPTGVSVQVLGSGGPLAGGSRASTSYIVWIDGRARILVDAGGGSFVRFGEAGARLDDLLFVGVSHLHPDHVADLPALLWLSDAARASRLAIAGPSGNASAPDVAEFLRRLFDAKGGAFPMLSGALGGSGRGVPLDVAVVDVAKRQPSSVFDREGVTVTAVGVPHGAMPALGYRVQVGNASIVFGGDQAGTDPRFIELAKRADLLVMHLATGVGESSQGHASPARVGQVAREAMARRLLVSHLGPGLATGGQLKPEIEIGPAVAEVRKYYDGQVTAGQDLACVPASK
jgi:ribonuclease BN (tRNA processing enzyme)